MPYAPVRVEFEDVDSYRIAHHSKLLAYLERGRTHFFCDSGIALSNLPFAVLVYDVRMRFIKPALLFDQLSVSAAIVEHDSFKFTVAQKIMRGDELLVKAQVTHALQDFASGQTIAIPDGFLQQLIQSQRSA